MPKSKRRFMAVLLFVIWLIRQIPPTWRSFQRHHIKLRRRAKATLAWLIVLPAAFATILFVLGTYRSHSGSVDFPPDGHRPALSLPFSCGTVPPSNPLYGSDVAVFHGQPLVMRATRNLGPVRLELSTNVSLFDVEDAGTRTSADETAQITRAALTSTCLTYVYTATGWVEFEAWSLFFVGLIIWRRNLRHVLPRMVIYILAVHVIWVLSLNQALHGATELKKAQSLAAIFKYQEFRTDPAAVGRINPMPVIAVGEDSRMSGWNNSPLVPHPSPTDRLCRRTRGNVAAILQQILQVSVLNTACPGADILSGVVTPEIRHGQVLPTQLGLIKSAPNLQYIVLDPLANQEGWGALVGSAMKTDVNFDGVPIAINSRIDQLRPVMDDLIDQLRTLHLHQPGHPRLVLVGTYLPFRVGVHCAATDGITDAEMALLNSASTDVNQYLASVAKTNKDFVTFLPPRLPPLCVQNTTGDGPMLVANPHSPYYMHPTPLGEALLAAEISQVIHLDLSRVPPATVAAPRPSAKPSS